ncbi:circularly permuted type 2 ATP-grasp protein [Nocardioides sp. YIM 152588]|uniref:circularly permuted type 2 ATP-grasp protein n=1 Tax=Nocardioides sp. YIM 152588 TaxID=3158259 RepID=UPI0032E51B9E
MTVLRDYVAGLTQPDLVSSASAPKYDEMVAPDGTLREGWKRLAELAVGIEPQELERVDEEIGRFLADDGVTYSRPGHRPSAWRLDPMPLIIDAASWQTLEVGLAQRAELLNAILVDLYGEQTLLRDGVVPPALIYGHAGFTRVMAGDRIADPRPLVLSATDLGRAADGTWRVLADRTQAPSGLGYAAQNRKVLSRVMPELYREAEVHRMAPYLWALRSALLQSAQGDLPDPRVVVLSPGSHSETFYDQAAIATNLGLPLVQGSDLVVRDGWVLMRTPLRLERVDVILRRVDATWSDPLELRGDSQLGVAGLAEAVRRGRVRVVNGLGAGVMENPGLQASMGAMCEHLLGEPLRLETVPTWWCGDPDGLDHVLDRLDELLVSTTDGTGVRVTDLAPEVLRRRILAAPHRYVAQERLPLSQAPAWNRGGVRPMDLSLRAFTLRYGSTYRPLLGGMASVRDGDRSVSSKDVWVLKAQTGEADQRISDVRAMTAVRSLPATVPRALEDMFWFGRYAERAEDMLRLVLAGHVLAEDFQTRPRTTGGISLDVMLGVIGSLAGRRYDDLDQEFRSLLLDADREGSAAHALASLRDDLAGVRDQLSADVWRVFGVAARAEAALRASPHSHAVAESAGRMLVGVLSLQGVTASMMRDPGWHMIGVGQHLERVLQLSRLLRVVVVRHGLEVDREVLTAVLASAESTVTHRRRYRDFVRPAGVLDLLLMDRDNPRSVAFSLDRAAEHLAAQPVSTGSTRPERLLADLIAELDGTDVALLVAIGGADRPNLAGFLGSLESQVLRITQAITEHHFATGPRPRSFGSLPVRDVLEPSALEGAS